MTRNSKKYKKYTLSLLTISMLSAMIFANDVDVNLDDSDQDASETTQILRGSNSRNSKHKRCRGGVNWPSYGKTLDNNRNACEEKILNRCNVKDLKIKWSFEVPVGNVTGSPATVDGVIYFGNGSPGPTGAGGNAYALDAETGAIIWQRNNLVPAFYDLTAAVGSDIVYITANTGTVYALRRSDGATVWQTQILQLPAQTGQGIFAAPVLLEKENLLFVMVAGGGTPTGQTVSSYGSVIALNASTGAQVWRYNTTGNTQPNLPNSGGNGAGIFGTPAIDTETGRLYIGTGQNRIGNVTPLSDALLAFNYRTADTNGELIWSHQFTPDDVGFCTNPPTCTTAAFAKDWDAAGGPYLVNIKDCNGQCLKLVIVGTKQGILYGFDRTTDGPNPRPLWTTFLTPPPPTGYQTTLTAPIPPIANPTCCPAPCPPCGPTFSFPVMASNNGGVNGFGCSDGENIYIGSSFSVTGRPIASSFGFGPNTAQVPFNSTVEAGTTFFAVRARDGKILWRKDVLGLAVTAMTVANGVVYSTTPLGTRINEPNETVGGIFRAQDAKTGEILFEFNNNPLTGANVRGNATFGSPTIYKGKAIVPMGNVSFVSGGLVGKAFVLAFGL